MSILLGMVPHRTCISLFLSLYLSHTVCNLIHHSLGPAHGHFSSEDGCNKYKPDTVSADRKNSAKESLQRYMHFYDRYTNHKQAEKFESNINERADLLASSVESCSLCASLSNWVH